MIFEQSTIRLAAQRRGFHLITTEILQAVPAIEQIEIGLLHLFIQHTSASLSINENADPDVPVDLEMAFNKIAPENFPYIHTMEGPDDMPAHVKSAMLGVNLTLPINAGRLLLGTWQGIYLCEHRNQAEGRNIIATVQGSEYK